MANALAEWWQTAKQSWDSAVNNRLGQMWSAQNPREASVMPGVNALAAREAMQADPRSLLRGITWDSTINDPMIGGWVGPAAIKVWHGSPHTFNKWESGKVGTGEGAAAYGYGEGGYHAESRDVAMSYQPRDPKFEDRVMRLYQQAETRGDYPAMQVHEAYLLHKTPDDVSAMIAEMTPTLSKSELSSVMQAHKQATDLFRKQTAGAMYQESLRWPDAAREARDPLGPQHFLDWDKPLSEQPAAVQQAIKTQMPSATWDKAKAMSGQDYYTHYWNAGVGGSGQPRLASSELENMGIPGIRYLDAGSRSAGEGTANYVVFSPDFVEILSRNGIPIPK